MTVVLLRGDRLWWKDAWYRINHKGMYLAKFKATPDPSFRKGQPPQFHSQNPKITK